jgi:hypothetical protein
LHFELAEERLTIGIISHLWRVSRARRARLVAAELKVNAALAIIRAAGSTMEPRDLLLMVEEMLAKGSEA